jgi:serine O-acetyltransferase
VLVDDYKRAKTFMHGQEFRRSVRTLISPGFQAIVIYRFGHWLIQQSLALRLLLKPVFGLLFLRMRARWGIELNTDAHIGKGIVIHHYGGIFVGADVVMGENVTLSPGVVLGLAGKGSRRGMPIIGDDVAISPGANISGKVHIGSHSRIGANAVVSRDVPEYGLVQVQLMPIVSMRGLHGNVAPSPGDADAQRTGAPPSVVP